MLPYPVQYLYDVRKHKAPPDAVLTRDHRSGTDVYMRRLPLG